MGQAPGLRRAPSPPGGQVQSYSGIAPVVVRSGKARLVQFRWACPKFLRQTFHEYAESSILFSDWARAFYNKQRARGKGRHAAIRSLAFKWIRILSRCWVDRVTYSEQRHASALPPRTTATSQTESQAAAQTGANEQFVWKKVAGFLKFSAATS